MALNNVSLSQYITGKLRQNLTDYNSSNRTSSYGNWVFPDWPMITKLLTNKNNFPRVSVESISHSGVSEMGMQDPEYNEVETLKITTWSVRDLICNIQTTSDEAHAYLTGTDAYDLTNLPVSDITSVTGTKDGGAYTFVKNTDYKLIDSDSDGFRDQIEWQSGADHPDNSTAFYVNYARKATGQELCRIIAQDIDDYLKGWRDWTKSLFWGYRMISANPINFDENIGVFRFEIQVQFNGINIGKQI